nr:MAG TPA: hypothetical protein [Caudoviricetes sp.]
MAKVAVEIRNQFTGKLMKKEHFDVDLDGDILYVKDEQGNEVDESHYMHGIVEFMKGQN